MKRRHQSMLTMLIFGMIVAGTVAAAEIKITKPLNGETVSTTQSIEGTSKDITDVQKMWIVVYIPSINRYYPQDRRNLGFNILADRSWWTKAIIGGPNDSGMEFQLFAALADENANNAIIGYLDESNRSGSWKGMENLPSGLTIFDRITVTRK